MVFINQEFEETTKNYKKGRTDERKEYLRSQISGLKYWTVLKRVTLVKPNQINALTYTIK